MRHSKFFCVDTIKMLYLTLVMSVLGFASVVWAPSGKGDSKILERIQKRLLRYMYYRNFGYYEQNITYVELYMRYELTSLKVRRDSAIILFLRDILNSKVESVSLLEKISFYIPPRIGRKRNNLFSLSCPVELNNLNPLHLIKRKFSTTKLIE